MSVLFIYDGMIKVSNDNEYYTDIFGDNLIQRYSFLNKEVEYVMRKTELDEVEKSKYTRISSSDFTFTSIPNPANIKGITINLKEIRKIIRSRILKSNFIIIRLPSFAGNIAIEECNKLNRDYLIEMVACPWDGFWNHSLKGKLVAPFMFLKTKKNLKNASYVIYVTNKFLQNRYPTNGEHTNCSNVALTEFDDKVLDRRLKKIASMQNTDRIVIGTTAAVNVRYKGQQYIIQALGELKKQGIIKFEYQLVGGGDQAFLKSIAEKYDVVDQVKFLGAMPHNRVFEWLETIDIYTQPSKQEGLPRALIESMSRAVPAFGANTAGIPELLEDRFIFSNTRKNIDEIIEILKCFDKETMIMQAKRNYEEAKKYDKNIIEERRRKFFEDFKAQR